MTQGERVNLIRKSKNLTLEKFGEQLGVTKTAIYNIEAGNRTLTNQMAKAICREFNISYAWLTEEVGEMEIDSDMEMMAMIDNLMVGENEFAKKAIKAAARFTDEQWAVLEQLVKSLVDDSDQ